MADQVQRILEAVFECTLAMINKDMHEYPEHRAQFFLLLKAITQYATPGLIVLTPAQFQLYMDRCALL